MLISQAFSLLGIPICKDVRMIKKAYQKQLPLHHPEVDPEGFMRLHEAYKLALNFAQDKIRPDDTAAPSFSWQPDTPCPGRNITGYDDLFANLDGRPTTDMTQPKKDYTRQLWRLKLHWLPIPLIKWCRFFSSETYLLCRSDAGCLEKLFDLLLEKIHSYPALLYLLDQLWELDIWLSSEAYDELSAKTRSCIKELRQQYPHYLKLGSCSLISRQFFPALWYYQALPFYFKLLVASILIPLLSGGSGEVLVLLLIGFYILEFCIWFLKIYRKVGIFHPTVRKKWGGFTVKCRGDSGWYIAITIYALIGHMLLCLAVMEAIVS